MRPDEVLFFFLKHFENYTYNFAKHLHGYWEQLPQLTESTKRSSELIIQKFLVGITMPLHIYSLSYRFNMSYNQHELRTLGGKL